MELVSVVVITYNSSKTIIETLDSILYQTYSNLELIVADDCSTDNTVEMVRAWIKAHGKRFVNARILRARNNHGVTKNCNIGLHQARGKYVELIAGDDLLTECAIEKKKIFAEKKGAKVVFTKVEVFGSGVSRVNFVKRYCEKGYRIVKEDWNEQYQNIILDNFIAGPSGNFFLTEYIQGIGGFDIRYPMLEDYPFIFHYIQAGNKIEMMDEELVQYRVSNTSIWGSGNKKYLMSSAKFFFLEVLGELMKNKKYKRALSKTKDNILMLLINS